MSGETPVNSVETYTSLFRTHKEMERIGEERYHNGEADPYVVEGEKDGKLLVFAGVRHSNDPDHAQWQTIKTKWQEFVSHKNEKKHLLIEGGVNPMIPDNIDRAIVVMADTGFIQHLAQKERISICCVEPDRKEEVDYLLSRFSPEELMAYYFARQVESWARGYKDSEPDWRKYTQGSMDRYETFQALSGMDMSVDNLVAIYEKVFGHDFDPEDRNTLNGESSPAKNPVASACSNLRNIKLMEGILEKFQAGYDVFVNYGAGHAFVLEPALRELLK
jgi:hypothetical protein